MQNILKIYRFSFIPSEFFKYRDSNIHIVAISRSSRSFFLMLALDLCDVPEAMSAALITGNPNMNHDDAQCAC